jgi:serine/threonine protein kinase
LQGLLGSGATAEVYRAHDQRLARTVAVKVFRRRGAHQHPRWRAHTEAKLGATLDNPALVRVLDVSGAEKANDTANDSATYVVFELADGPNLAERLSFGALTLPNVAMLGTHIAAALAYLHHHQIVHHDVKPANIVLTPTYQPTDPPPVKLTDLGSARLIGQSSNTGPNHIVASPTYASPENLQGEPAAPPGDVYSLGLVLLEALTGRRAFPGRSIDAVMARLHEAPAVPGWLNADWITLLRAMTARAPGERPSAAEAEALLRAMRRDPADAPYPVALAPRSAMVRRVRTLMRLSA